LLPADSEGVRVRSGPWVDRPVVPYFAVVCLGLAATLLDTRATNWQLVGMAGGVAVLFGSLALAVPWPKLPEWSLLILPIACDGLIAALRQAQGGNVSGYSPLSILPVVWVGLMLRGRAVTVMTICTLALFGLPIAIVGAPLYPDTGWRGVFLWTVVAAFVGKVASNVVTEQRAQTSLADARAGELDQLFETQNAIASAELFNLDAVMTSIVGEALVLTKAEGAVVELPEGDELVHRATAGTAVDYQGARLKQNHSLSGLCLSTGEQLYCEDSETDPRVDREVARRTNARSAMVVPLVFDGKTTGVLKVWAAAPKAFDEDQARVLGMLAHFIGTALGRAELMEKLREQAVTDELTRVTNRRAWYQQLARAMAQSRRSGQTLSILILDVDGLKETNDALGHAAGDELLRSLARQWASELREADLLGRIGGDEFAVILEDTEEDAAFEVARRLDALHTDRERASIGIAVWDGEETAAELIARADLSMYRYKRAGDKKRVGAPAVNRALPEPRPAI
jgi:diguanylate cyclase